MSNRCVMSIMDLGQPAEEAYRILRTNLRFGEQNQSVRAVTVTSYLPGEGKTTTCVNLVSAFAKAGFKALYIDGDLRKSVLSYEVRPDNFKGLSDYLDGRAEMDEIIHEIGIDGFSYITCGLKSANSAELLGSPNFEKLIKAVQERFDVVIIDTPSMCCAIDCAVIAPFTYGVIIVIDPAKANTKQTRFQIEQLKKVNTRILGVVLNKIVKKDYKKYYRGYEFYKKYSPKA